MSALNTVCRVRRLPIGGSFHPDKPPKTYSGTPVPQSFGDVAPRFDCDTAAKMDMAMRTIVRTRSCNATATINVQEYTLDSKGNSTPGALTTQTSTLSFLPITEAQGTTLCGGDELSSMAGLVTETLYDADGGGLNGSGVYKVGTDNFSTLIMSLLRRSDPADQRLPFIFTFDLNVGFPLQVYGQAVSAGGQSVGALDAHATYTIPHPLASLTFNPFPDPFYFLQNPINVSNPTTGNYSTLLIQSVTIAPVDYWPWDGRYDPATGKPVS